MAGWTYLVFSLLGAAIVYNAARPSLHPFRLVPSWLLAFLTTDLAFLHILLAAIVTALFAWGGALATLPDWQPDNSVFATEADSHTTARLARLQALRESQ